MKIIQEPIEVLDIDHLSPQLSDKYVRLKSLVTKMGRVIVAYSGGIDSSLIVKVAYDTLGSDMLAAMAISESYSTVEKELALEIIKEIGAPYELLTTREVHDPRYAANPANRCYYCKQHLYEGLFELATEQDFSYIADGFNADDVGDHRPGRKAGLERGVRSPLYEAGLTKKDVRSLARYLGLSNWAKPSMACLSSRVAYDQRITPKILGQIEQAERALFALGLGQLRVRHHDNIARVEVLTEDMPQVLAQRDRIVADLKAAGYVYVTLDLQGFRSGSSNEVLTHHG